MKEKQLKERKKLKIGMYNVEAGRGTTKNYLQYVSEFWKNFGPIDQKHIEAVGKFIGEQDLDIVCLTEVEGNGGSLRSNNLDQVKLISEISGLPYHNYFEAYSRLGWFRLGNAILSKYPVTKEAERIMLGGINPRVVGKGRVDFNGEPIEVYTTQFSLGEEARHKQMDYVSEMMQGENLAILGADVNEQRSVKLEEMAREANMELVHTPATYPAWGPSRTLDYLMARGFEIESSWAHEEIRHSDHIPITAEIYLEK